MLHSGESSNSFEGQIQTHLKILTNSWQFLENSKLQSIKNVFNGFFFMKLFSCFGCQICLSLLTTKNQEFTEIFKSLISVSANSVNQGCRFMGNFDDFFF